MKALTTQRSFGCRLRGRPPSAEATEKIVEAATTLFLTKGYGATTMQDVARRFGGSKQTIYARFPDKKALVEAVVAAFVERKLQIPRQVAAAQGPAEQALPMLAHAMLQSILDHESVQLLRLVIAECHSVPELADIMQRRSRLPGLEMVRLVMVRLIEEEQVKGDADLLSKQFCEMVLLPQIWDALFEPGQISVTAEKTDALNKAVAFFLSAAAPEHGEN